MLYCDSSHESAIIFFGSVSIDWHAHNQSNPIGECYVNSRPTSGLYPILTIVFAIDRRRLYLRTILFRCSWTQLITKSVNSVFSVIIVGIVSTAWISKTLWDICRTFPIRYQAKPHFSCFYFLLLTNWYDFIENDMKRHTKITVKYCVEIEY